LKCIGKSEGRVLELLDWKLSFVTTMDVIEVILMQLGLDDRSYRKAYTMSTYILDYVLLSRELVYDKLYERLAGKYTDCSR
jgi:hypothetical protein